VIFNQGGPVSSAGKTTIACVGYSSRPDLLKELVRRHIQELLKLKILIPDEIRRFYKPYLAEGGHVRLNTPESIIVKCLN
jgi:hypothetical protein